MKSPEPAATEPDAEPAEPKDTADRLWRQLAVACLALLALVNCALAIYAFHSLTTLRRNIDRSLWRNEQGYQDLDAQIDYDSGRRSLLLGLRDEILQTNPSLDWAQAYRYASLAVSAAERYPAVDPILLVSLGIAQSGYDTERESVAGARGLYQLFPTTARLLARSLGWEYTDELLFEPARNTELASLYLQTLFAVHEDRELALVEYREGALSAGLLRAGSDELDRDAETYLNEVQALYERMASEHGGLPNVPESAPESSTGDTYEEPVDSPRAEARAPVAQ